MISFSEKKEFVLESGMTIEELRQILSELEEDAAQAEADNLREAQWEEGYHERRHREALE